MTRVTEEEVRGERGFAQSLKGLEEIQRRWALATPPTCSLLMSQKRRRKTHPSPEPAPVPSLLVDPIAMEIVEPK